MEQKCEIANAEQERLAQEIGDNRKASEKLADTLRAVLEETDIRIAELKKEHEDPFWNCDHKGRMPDHPDYEKE